MQEKLAAFLEYIDEDVLHHWGHMSSPDAAVHSAWLSNLGHDVLAIFHFDATMLILVTLLLCLVGVLGRKKIGRIPQGLGTVLENYVLFVRDAIVYPNFGGAAHGRPFVPFFCSIFLFILLANLLGLVPLFTSATGNVAVTAGLALIFFGFGVFSMLRIQGAKGIVHAFLPSGLPGPMKPLMFLMEVISLCTRTFALAVRLFANMLGGHIVLYAMISLTAIFGMIATPSLLVAVALYFFEVFVACLQAYVFTMLAAIFTGMLVHPQH